MDFNQIILYGMAFGVVLGGMDRMLGNRLGFGDKFEQGFQLLGPVALSMAGIICLAPLLSRILAIAVVPLCRWMGMDPGIFGSILAIDMGGYQLAMDLCADPALGAFSGIIVAAVFGCTVVFTIPVGLAAIPAEQRPDFTRGILLGFGAMPAAIAVGGLVIGIDGSSILWNSLPVLLIALALAAGVLLRPEAMMAFFRGFAALIRGLATLGLTLAAAAHLTGVAIVEGMSPLTEAMETVCSICIVMLGSMPLAELIQRVMKKPFGWLQSRTGLSGTCTTALLLGMVSTTPALALLSRMDRRNRTVCAAGLVCGAGVFGAHLAFTVGVQPGMTAALLAAKITGMALGLLLALTVTGREHEK
ncbi:MAG: ethanolamine utilization protein EutH [Oscillospiraceae bacterium]|nr:ethanolamine utilization protein EutH [Oscillospiraceae bacterium]